MCAWLLADSIVFSPVEQSLTTLDGSKTISLSIREVLLLNALLQKESDKRRLIEIVWPNSVVSDSSYHKLLFELRTNITLIGLPANTIKTIPRRGCSINILAVEISEPSWQCHPHRPDTLNEGGSSKNLEHGNHASSKDEISFRLDEGALPLRNYNVKDCDPSEPAPCSKLNYKVTSLLLASAIAISLLIFYTIYVSSFYEVATYHVENNKGKSLLSLNEARPTWNDIIVNRPFLTGFSYTNGDETVYFLCEKKEGGKCENHILSSH